MYEYYFTDELAHHGIKGQRWGVKNGPPYPLSGGDFSQSEREAIKKKKHRKYSIYNKKHYDMQIKAGNTISTLSYDKDRTKNADMFYAVSNKGDRHFYNVFFNHPMPKEDGGVALKYRITNTATKDIDVASEDSGAEIFKDLYRNDRDFYNYVTDKDRMRELFVKDKYKFKGYRESAKVLDKIDSGEEVTDKDVKTLYRMFNYTIPAQGKDIENQRKKFFDEAKKRGYEALLDTNDAIYGGFKAKTPIIVIDPEAVYVSQIKQTTMNDRRISKLVNAAHKALGI